MSKESGTVWIGPSKCDDARVSREERLKKAWQVLVSCDRFTDMYLVAGSSIDLFREALSCYQNGAFMATILMCGVVLESLLYDLVSAVRGRAECDDGGRVWSVEQNSELYGWKFDRLISEAKKLGLLDGKLEAKISVARNLRNTVAHYSQRSRKQLLEAVLKQGAERNSSILRGAWANDEEAYNTLERTAKIMRILIKRAHTMLCKQKAT